MLPGSSDLTQEPRFRQRIGRSSVKDRGELLNDHGLEVGPKKNGDVEVAFWDTSIVYVTCMCICNVLYCIVSYIYIGIYIYRYIYI